MRAVVTRVKRAVVSADGEVCGKIAEGFLVLLGVAPQDTEQEASRLADKVCGTRVFEDADGKMNLNLAAVGGELLIVSQFTLFADLKSRRPSFSAAAKAEAAIPLYEKFIAECQSRGFKTAHGIFGAAMQVESLNDGPVTLLFDTDEL